MIRSTTAHKGLDGGTVVLMAFAAGLFVASIYYHQPMLGIFTREFRTGADGVSAIAFSTQLGYALGLVLVASLGDMFERRRLIFITTMALAGSLFAAAAATNIVFMVAASFLIGILATVAQQVVPMAAHLAEDGERGRVIGTVMAGLLSGILLARIVSGVVAEYVGWRYMFAIAGAVVVITGFVLRFRLPVCMPLTKTSYLKTLGSLASLIIKYKPLRKASIIQALLFATFVAFWANLALYLEEAPFHKGSSVAGLLGILGLAGVLAAPIAGRINDRKKADSRLSLVIVGCIMVLFSFVLFGFFKGSWSALIAGIIIMDCGIQMSMISNQSMVYGLDAEARSRVNTVYVTTMFFGGSFGALFSAHAFALFGWNGVCLMGLVCSLLAILVYLFYK